MRFYEYESKALFRERGLPLGKGRVVRSPEEARAAAAEIGGPVVVKSQVLSGGRMKAGAVQFAGTPEEAAGAIFFLCSPWSNFVQGQVLTVNGGQATGMTE